MKILYISLFLILNCLNLFAQTITGTLKRAAALKVGDELIVSGFDKHGVFTIISYDKTLAIKKQYSKQLGKNIDKKTGYLNYTDDGLVCLLMDKSPKRVRHLIKLNRDFEEISYGVYESIDVPYRVANNNSNYYYNSPFYGGLKREQFLNPNEINPALKFPEDVAIMNAVHDSSHNRIIAAGNYFDLSEKPKNRTMKGLVILKLSKEGNIITEKKFDFPFYPFKETGFYKCDDRKTDVNAIIFLESGNIALVCTQIGALYFGGGVTRTSFGGTIATFPSKKDCTMGFSYYEFNDTLGMVSSSFYPFESTDFRDAKFTACSFDGREILFDNVATSTPQSSETLYFPANGAPYLKQNYFDRSRSYNHFLVNDHAAIIFKSNKRSYELKVIKLK